jgi:hypothetical protein
MVQVKLLDGHSLASLAIGRLDRAEIFATAAHDDDAPALGGLFGIGAPDTPAKIMVVGRERESPRPAGGALKASSRAARRPSNSSFGCYPIPSPLS